MTKNNDDITLGILGMIWMMGLAFFIAPGYVDKSFTLYDFFEGTGLFALFMSLFCFGIAILGVIISRSEGDKEDT